MIDDTARIWYCPNEACDAHQKNVKEYSKESSKMSVSVGRCPICKTSLKTMKGVIKK